MEKLEFIREHCSKWELGGNCLVDESLICWSVSKFVSRLFDIIFTTTIANLNKENIFYVTIHIFFYMENLIVEF